MSDNGRKASVVYEGNGSHTVFLFPFDYLRKAFIYAQDIQNDNVKDLVQGVDFSVDNNRHIHINTPLKAGHLLRIYRKTTTKPLVEWQDASVLRSADLTLQEVQLLHLAEETADKVADSAGLSVDPMNNMIWNANFKRIGNVLDPQEPQDVVTLNYILSNEDNIINNIKRTGQAQVAEMNDVYNTSINSIKSTGNSYSDVLKQKGIEETQKVITTATHKMQELQEKGNAYIQTQTDLKNETAAYAAQAKEDAKNAKSNKDIAERWATSTTTPDGETDNESPTEYTQSSRSWALHTRNMADECKEIKRDMQQKLDAAAYNYRQTNTQLQQCSTLVDTAKTQAEQAQASAANSKTYMEKSEVYKNQAKTEADKAAESARKAAKFDVSNYLPTAENDKRYLKQTDAENTYLKMTDAANTYLKKDDAAKNYQPKGKYVTESVWNAAFSKIFNQAIHKPVMNIAFSEVYGITFNSPLIAYLTKKEIENNFQPKGNYITQDILDNNYVSKQKANAVFIQKKDLYDGDTIQLPNGAKIGVE